MTEREKLKKQIDKLISDEITNPGRFSSLEDMTPTMSDIYHWGVRNLPIKEMKKIIKDNEVAK